MNTKLKIFLALGLCLAFIPSPAAARAIDTAQVLDGYVVLTRIGDFNAVVLIDHLPIGGDGIADQAFIYRSTVALPADLRNLSGAGIVVVRPQTIAVTLPGKSNISLSVRTGAPADERFRRGAISKAGVTRVDSGFELQRLYGREGFDLVSATFNQLKPRRDGGLLKAEEESGCASGGEGSTGCSLEGNIGPGGAGCSVDCGSGYYSCCTVTGGCKCVRSGGDEEAYLN